MSQGLEGGEGQEKSELRCLRVQIAKESRWVVRGFLVGCQRILAEMSKDSRWDVNEIPFVFNQIPFIFHPLRTESRERDLISQAQVVAEYVRTCVTLLYVSTVKK